MPTSVQVGNTLVDITPVPPIALDGPNVTGILPVAHLPVGAGNYPSVNVCFKGDSITYGQEATAPGTASGNGTSYPAIAMGLLGPNYTGYNFGIPGETVASMLTDATVSQIDALCTPTSILIFEGGINDAAANATADQINASTLAWLNARKAAGWTKIFVLTIQSTSVPVNPTFTAVNAWRIANAATVGYTVIDVTSNALLNDPTNRNYRFSDDVHYIDAGYAVYGGVVATAIFAANVVLNTSSTAITLDCNSQPTRQVSLSGANWVGRLGWGSLPPFPDSVMQTDGSGNYTLGATAAINFAGGGALSGAGNLNAHGGSFDSLTVAGVFTLPTSAQINFGGGGFLSGAGNLSAHSGSFDSLSLSGNFSLPASAQIVFGGGGYLGGNGVGNFVGIAANTVTSNGLATLAAVLCQGNLTVDGAQQVGTNGTGVVLHRIVTATLAAGTVTISDANITVNSNCAAVNRPAGYGGTLGTLYVSAQSAGHVTITSTSATATNLIAVTIEN